VNTDWRSTSIPAKVGSMSFMDKAKDLLNQHDDKVDQALDKVGEAAKGRFAGHDAQIDGLIDQAQQRTGAGDTTAPGTLTGAPAEEQQFEQQPPRQ
jgi:hypothetical protein